MIILLSILCLNDTIVVTFKVRRELLERLDELVKNGYFSSRSEAIRTAIIMLINTYNREEGDGKELSREDLKEIFGPRITVLS